MDKNIFGLQQKLLRLLCLPKSIYFNFKYLPFRQAIRLPFLVGPKVKLAQMGGKVMIGGPITRFMISIGEGFADFYDTFQAEAIWRVQGTVIFNGPARLGPGFRLSVGEKGTLTFGDKFKITASAAIACKRAITFGDDVIIAWGTQISDTDWHSMVDESGNILNPEAPVQIGNHVWIGTNVIILRATQIPNGCILAAGAVVKGVFTEPASLIGGIPAAVIKKNVLWKR